MTPRKQEEIDALLADMPEARWADCVAEPPPLDFVLPGLLAGSVGLLVGQGAIGKTMLGLEIARGVAMGDGVAASDEGALSLYQPHEIGPGSVGMLLGEDPIESIRWRMHDLIKAHKMTADDVAFLTGFCSIRSSLGVDMALVTMRGSEIIPGPFLQKLEAFCSGRRLVLVDPLLLLAGGLDETNNTVMGRVMRALTRVAHDTNCAILVLHHVSKTGGIDGREEQDRSRGASSITASVRLQLDMRKATAKEMDDLGIPDDQRDYYVRIAQVKANHAAPRPAVWLRRMAGGVLSAVGAERRKAVAEREAEPAGQARRAGRKGGVNASPF